MADMEKQALLVVSFGTSYHDTCQRTIGAIEADMAASFPRWEVRRAFTSSMIRQKLLRRDGLAVDSVEEALARLAAENFSRVVCQPTHIINGEEFDGVLRAISGYAPHFQALSAGRPLLTTTRDYQELVRTVHELYPPEDDTALCLMGHGSEHHFADSAYAALDYHFKDFGRRDIHVGTVEGFPHLPALLKRVQEQNCSKVVLAPLMVVAGDHALNDMASEEEDSWKSMFTAQGYSVSCVVKGLGEYEQIRRQYLRHAKEAMDRWNEPE